MIAIPVKTDKPDTAVAPLFGKAKWFALVDDEGIVTFWRNELGSGRAVVDHFGAQGVTTVIFQEMGGNPFMLLGRAGIACYHAGAGRIVLNDLLDALRAGTLQRVTTANMDDFVEQGRQHAQHDHGAHGHHHEHEHEHAHGHCGGAH